MGCSYRMADSRSLLSRLVGHILMAVIQITSPSFSFSGIKSLTLLPIQSGRTMRKKILFYIIFAVIPMLLFSCENYKDCNAPVQTSLGIGFFQMLNGTPQDSTLPALTMFGIGRADSLLYYQSPVQNITVPLNANTDTTAFYVQPDSTMTTGDTLTLTYTRSLQFVSSGCGFTTFYHIDTVFSTYHLIDSIAITAKTINTTNVTNIQIYY